MSEPRVEIDPPNPNDPTKISGRILFDEPPIHMIGLTAGELRAMGMDIPERVPDCSKCEQADDGGWKFSWVTVSFVLDPPCKHCGGTGQLMPLSYDEGGVDCPHCKKDKDA